MKGCLSVIFTLVAIMCAVTLVGMFVSPNGVGATFKEGQQNIREAEKLLSETTADAVIWQGTTYSKYDFEKEIKEGKKELRSSLLSIGAMVLVTVAVLLLSLFCLSLTSIDVYRCPQCKKMLVMEKKDTVFVGSEDTHIAKSFDRRDSNGVVIGTEDHPVAAKRNTYKTTYKCKFCGYEKYKYKSRTVES